MNRLQRILVIVVALGIVGYVAYRQIGRRHERKLQTAIEQERNEWKDTTGKLKEKVVELEKELAQEREESPVPEEKLVKLFGKRPTVISPGQEEISCEELQHQIKAFFAYLDNKKYITSYNLEEGTYDLFQKILQQLSEAPPMISDEMKDLVSLTHNAVHFYGVLGEKRIEIAAKVLKNEYDTIEPVMATFFAWFDSCDRCAETTKTCPSLDVLYEYAGFFLNTLGGRSYLLRRNSKIRTLASYYCILVLDTANKETLNRHGIDIRPYVDLTLSDINNQKGLIHRKQYVAKLKDLRKKYRL